MRCEIMSERNTRQFVNNPPKKNTNEREKRDPSKSGMRKRTNPSFHHRVCPFAHPEAQPYHQRGVWFMISHNNNNNNNNQCFRFKENYFISCSLLIEKNKPRR